jgi:hypothetical protein
MQECSTLAAGNTPAYSDRKEELAETVLTGESGAAPESIAPVTAVIGRYKLIRELGKGGFGIVWQAEQTEPIQREVALKIIKPGMDTLEIIKRFETERQSLAMMDHPNIAAVLDAGTTEQGRPYFVMELVKGAPITEYCNAHDFGIRERLELFIPVCQAVQHAHQKAILHRDLKPSNILVMDVDGQPVPKVIDFGIAKALGNSDAETLQASLALTREGMVVGTPQYMSPEQAGSMPDVDTRSDIYTLGVILYELLTGQTPLSPEQMRKRGFDEVLRLIREEEIKRPSSRVGPLTKAAQKGATGRYANSKTLNASLRGDLDWIILKALEKERERRYETANALAKDLRRCLDDEPVSAGPPSAGYRLRKLVRRNRLAFGAALGIVFVLIAGVVASTWQAVRARKAEKLSLERLGQAERARDAAENLIADAIFGLRDKLIPIGKIAVLEGMEKAAEDYYGSLPPELASSTTHHHQARLAINRGLVAAARSDDDATEEAALAALGMARKLAAAYPDDMRFVDDEMTALILLAVLRTEQDDFGEATACTDEACQLADRWLARDPKARQPLLIKLTAAGQRMFALESQGSSVAAALPTFSEMQNLGNRLKQLGGESMETVTVDALGKLGNAMLVSKTGNDLLTKAAFDKAEEGFNRAIQTYGEHVFTRQMMLVARNYAVGTLNSIASRTGNAGMKKEAERQRAELVREREKLTELEPQRLDWWKELAVSYHDLVRPIGEREGPAAELAWSEKAFVTGEKAASPHCDRPRFRRMRVGNRVSLVSALRKAKPEGYAERALQLISEAVEIDFAPLKHGRPDIDLRNHWELGRDGWEILMDLDTPDRAAETLKGFRELIATKRRILEAAADKARALRDGAEAAGKMADHLQQRGRTAEATEFVKQRDDWKRDLATGFGNDPTVLADRLNAASDDCWKLLNDIRSAPTAQKAAAFTGLESRVREARAFLEEKHAYLSEYDYARFRGAFESAIGAGLLEAQRFAEAEAPLRAALQARNEAAAKAKDPNDAVQKRWDASDPLLKLGLAAYKQGRIAEGQKLRREGAEIRETIAREHPSPGRFRDSGNAWRNVADLLATPELVDDRLAALKKSVELSREGLRLARASESTPKSDLRYCRSSAAWALLNLGYRLRDAKHLVESEAPLREALAISMEHVAEAPGSDPDRTRQLSNIRYDLAKTLIELGRPDEARAQNEEIVAEVKAFEDKSGHRMPEFDEARRRVDELNQRLGIPAAK